MLRAAAAAMIVVLAGCAGSDADRQSGAPAASMQAPTWDSVAATLRPGLDASSANPCQRGDRSCLDLLLAEMERRVGPLRAACDHNVLFATVYVDLTESIRRAVDSGRLQHPAEEIHFAAWFAHLYFDAFDAWHGRTSGRAPDAWAVAFDAAREKRVRGMGDLLLGINAHITRDLTFAVADLVHDPELARADFALVTDLIERESTRSMERLAAEFDPELANAALPLALAGRPTVAAAYGAWREEAWQRGLLLAQTSDAERPAVEAQLELNARTRGEAIRAASLYAPLVEGPERRDAYCAAHRTGS